MHESSRSKSLFVSRRLADGREDDHGMLAIRRNPWVRYILLGTTLIIVALFFPRSSPVEFQYEVGSIWSGDSIYAQFAFPLYKDEKTYQRDADQAAAAVLPIYIPTGMTPQKLQDTLLVTIAHIARSQSRPPYLSDPSWAVIRMLPPNEPRIARLNGIAQVMLQGVIGAFRSGVISPLKAATPGDKILIRRNEVYEDIVPLSALYDSVGVWQIADLAVRRRLSPEEGGVALNLLEAVFKPTCIYSPTLTEEARSNARASVPRSQGLVREGELIVGEGERISEATKLMLNSYQRSRQRREETENSWWQLAGNVGHVAILLGLVVLYLYNFRRRIYNDNLQLAIIAFGLMLMAFMAWLSITIQVSLPIEYLILIPLFSMLLAILFDSRTAFYHTVVACFLVAGIRGNDSAIAIAGLSAGVLAAYTVRDIKSRTQLFRSILYSLLGYALAICALGLERGEVVSEVGLRLGFAAINATLSPVLTFALILLLENAFGIATDLKLLEYDNLNHPLLRALADKAPGTYQHTLTIARLAESAAVAIGANALLAKVGSLYHDIGKIAKAEYFVENQMGMLNKHDKIKPEMSARIIREHVLDGIELAQEYHLPQRIIDFIPMHHGTTPIKYFLDKARELNPDVNPDLFRYPGPLPHSRETAIVMLADAVEATTRSLPNPTSKAIAETVDKAIKKRFTEGQLDQCELTLADLDKIKTAFTKNLIGMSHPRIQYKPEAADQIPEAVKPENKPRKEKDEPVIPYIDDAFGSTDAAFYYGKSAEKKQAAPDQAASGETPRRGGEGDMGRG
jgi:putative nucleotidyltransferase with HDIG domain